MSLQVWLPLTQDLRNQGLANITSSGTPVFKNSGKLGSKSLDLNTRINFSCPALNNVSTFSVAFWAKTNQDSNISGDWMDVLGLTDISIGGSGGQLRWETCYTTGAPTRGISVHDNNTYATIQGHGQATLKGNWNHFCITVDPSGSGRAIEYWDGVKIGDYAASGGHLNGNFWTGETNKVNGEIQDIRIYDHALSPLEVKQMSQVLELHYPLNRNGWGQENLLPCGGTYTQSSPWTTTLNRTDGYAFVTNSGFEATPGKTYTISVECDGNLYSAHGGTHNPSDKHWTFWAYISNINTTANWQNGGYDTPRNLTSSNNNYRKIGNTHVWTITLTDSQKYIGLRTNSYSNGTDNVTIKWWNMKVEEGDTFTGWSPNSSSELGELMNLNSTIEYDCAGYCNNLNNFTNITYTSDTPKYSVSTFLSGSTYGSHNNFYSSDSYQNAMTVACWVKRTFSDATERLITNSWVRLYTYTDFKVRLTWTMSTGNADTTNTWASGQILPLNEWTHVCFTMQDGIVKCYINGTLKNTSDRTQYGTYIHGVIGNGFGGLSASTKQWIGGLSDFRLYATALSADDVKSLYNNSAYIDNQGNIYGAVYEEV